MHCDVKTILYLWIMADKSLLRQKQRKGRHKKKGPGSCLKETIINKKTKRL